MLDDSLGSSSLEPAQSRLYPRISGSNYPICFPDADSTSSLLGHKLPFLLHLQLQLREGRIVGLHREGRQRRTPTQRLLHLHLLIVRLKRFPITLRHLRRILVSRKHVPRTITTAFHHTPSHTRPRCLSHPYKPRTRTFTSNLAHSTRTRMYSSPSRQDLASHHQHLRL